MEDFLAILKRRPAMPDGTQLLHVPTVPSSSAAAEGVRVPNQGAQAAPADRGGNGAHTPMNSNPMHSDSAAVRHSREQTTPEAQHNGAAAPHSARHGNGAHNRHADDAQPHCHKVGAGDVHGSHGAGAAHDWESDEASDWQVHDAAARPQGLSVEFDNVSFSYDGDREVRFGARLFNVRMRKIRRRLRSVQQLWCPCCNTGCSMAPRLALWLLAVCS